MWTFYWRLVRKIPHTLRSSMDLTVTCLTAVSFVLTLIGPHLVDSWSSLPPWVPLIPVGLFFVYGMMRANYEHFREQEKSFADILEVSDQDKDRLKSELSSLKSPEIPPETMDIVREGWDKLEPYEREGVKLLTTHGDMTDRVARLKLNLLNLANLFPRIEERTNFVQHTSQSYDRTEALMGYQGTWTINPHFKAAIENFLKSPGGPS